MAISEILLEALQGGAGTGPSLVDQYAEETARRKAEDDRIKKLRSDMSRAFMPIGVQGSSAKDAWRLKKEYETAVPAEKKRRKEFDDLQSRRSTGSASTLLSTAAPQAPGSLAKRRLFGE